MIKYELALFAGIGGGILGGELLGRKCVGAVEIEPYARKSLLTQQRCGTLPRFPIWDNITTFRSDNPECAEFFSVMRSISSELAVSGGFPCKGISPARTNSKLNGKLVGVNGGSSELWFEMERIISEIRPGRVDIENSKNLRSHGLCRVLKGLASLGYNAQWGCVGGRSFGSDHARSRMWITAQPSNSYKPQQQGGGVSSRIHQKDAHPFRSDWWKNQPNLERVANGSSSGLDANWGGRLKGVGNAQIPIVAAAAYKILGDIE